MDGTIAEKLVPGGASAGASSDLQRDTQVVRRRVTEFGMRPTLGRVSNQAEVRSPFRGGGGVNNASWCEPTAREIDLEARRLLDDALKSARAILDRRRDALDDITETPWRAGNAECFRAAGDPGSQSGVKIITESRNHGAAEA